MSTLPNTLTFDLETETGVLFKRRASPFHPDNYVVAAGFKYNDGDPFGDYFKSKELSRQHYSLPFADDTELLVGFNIKFDLLWSWHRQELMDFFRRGGRIWDCQYVEYLLEGQQQHVQYASMDSCVEKYGGTLKIDAVKEQWNAGVQTSAIDETLLMDYLLGNPEQEIEGDINNTYLIFRGQYERAQKVHPNFMAMLERRHDGLLATTEMEYNGIFIDIKRGEEDRARLAKKSEELTASLAEFIPADLPEEVEFNWGSLYHRSYIIFGGTLKYDKWVQHEDPDSPDGLAWAKKTEKWPLFDGEPVDPVHGGLSRMADSELYQRRQPDGSLLTQDTYKSGKNKGAGKTRNVKVADLERPKGAKQPHYYTFAGHTQPLREWEMSLTDGKDKPLYSTSSEVIEFLGNTRTDTPFLRIMGELQALNKDLGTYYWNEDTKTGERKGMLTLVDHTGTIHHKLNHTATVTTRLSSSDPNMQNIPRGDKSEAKAMFASRFGGVMAEIDYSQLEVVIQGVLSRDPQLLQDLKDGVDFHCKRLAAKLGETYESVVDRKKEGDPAILQQRTEVKEFSFQRAYGAGAKAVAASTGMDVMEVEALIEAEERMYPGIIRFDNLVQDSIAKTAVTTSKQLFVAGMRFQAQRGEWFSPTGTRYVWTEHEAPSFLHSKGKYVGFSPTERKNWPVQGDGGFVVQAMLGYVWRYFLKNRNFRGQALMVNTVHDCAWFDIASEELAVELLPQIKRIMEAVPSMYKRNFNIDVPVPFPTEVEMGPNMLELEHVM